MQPGKLAEGGCCANDRLPIVSDNTVVGLPKVLVDIDGTKVWGLVDTGCTTTVVDSTLLKNIEGKIDIMAFDGKTIECRGMSIANINIKKVNFLLKVIAADKLIDGVRVILGMDAITRLGGVRVDSKQIVFGKEECATAVTSPVPSQEMFDDKIDDVDFEAKFNGNRWVVQWKWKEEMKPVLYNKTERHEVGLSEEEKQAYEQEVDSWISEGILQPWSSDVSEGIIPLMAVIQPTKNKVRPVLDYRELNRYVKCHTGDEMIDICGDKLREWRMVEGDMAILDLKKAYLQIGVDEKLWKYQLVRYKGQTYCLTRLGFGLCSAPRIMSIILKHVLAKNRDIQMATSSYVDDILVNTTSVPCDLVKDHLKAYGFATKPAEALTDGSVLGLKVHENSDGKLIFRRGNIIPEIPVDITRRQLFSVCGSMVGHYPVAGWLRIACSYIKRRAEGQGWDDYAGDVARNMIVDVLVRIRIYDPVNGYWSVPKTESGVVWCDASNIATGVILEIGGVAVEDASWLRKKEDFNHINVAELDGVLKGINLAVKWGLTKITVKTDSATVLSWIQLTLSEERKVKTRGAAEVIVKRRLGILKSLVDELGLVLEVIKVPTDKNKADSLTRVRKEWLETEKAESGGRDMCAAGIDLVQSHNQHHMGVDRSLYVARLVDPSVARDNVRKIVKSCQKCQSIDPAPVTHNPGELNVSEDWKRVALDVTHYKGVPYLTLVDCGPGRFAIWRELTRETGECIKFQLNQIFLERGPVQEVLMDNSTAFHSVTLAELFERWKIRRYYRAAYRPSGNGIVERNHRTIKALAERTKVSPCESVFWYNISPRSGQKSESVPQQAVYKYEWRHPEVISEESCEIRGGKLSIGDEVWVKPPNMRCTTEWKKGSVTGIISDNNILVDGMARHVLDLRRVVSESCSEQNDSNVEEICEPSPGERYPRRERHPPRWMTDYAQ